MFRRKKFIKSETNENAFKGESVAPRFNPSQVETEPKISENKPFDLVFSYLENSNN